MSMFSKIKCRGCGECNPFVFEQVEGNTCLCLDCADLERASAELEEQEALEDAAIECGDSAAYWTLRRAHKATGIADKYAALYQKRRKKWEGQGAAEVVAMIARPFNLAAIRF